ncbi:MAG: DUF2017 domain-containing protein [Frankiales bacterium]|nr:DUF2017 domain-containing protein [Frankiales bacterium]
MDVRREAPGLVVSLVAEEAAIVGVLAAQVAAMLAEDNAAADPDAADPLVSLTGLDDSAPAERPSDPALQRLLPDAYSDDAEAAGEFRRLTDGELRREKVDALTLLVDACADPTDGSVRVGLDDAVAERWLQAINDVRLVLGVRLDVTEDMSERWSNLDPADPQLPLLLGYDLLSLLQQEIIEALDG